MCDKKVFDSEKQAVKAAKQFAEMRGGEKQRPYFCNDCHAYHLTTQPLERKRKTPYIRKRFK